MPDCFYDFPKISGTVRGWNQLWCKSCNWVVKIAELDIYVLVAETSWFGHSLLDGSNMFARIVDTWDDDGPGPEISFSTFEDYAGSLEYIARELGPV